MSLEIYKCPDAATPSVSSGGAPCIGAGDYFDAPGIWTESYFGEGGKPVTIIGNNDRALTSFGVLGDPECYGCTPCPRPKCPFIHFDRGEVVNGVLVQDPIGFESHIFDIDVNRNLILSMSFTGLEQGSATLYLNLFDSAGNPTGFDTKTFFDTTYTHHDNGSSIFIQEGESSLGCNKIFRQLGRMDGTHYNQMIGPAAFTSTVYYIPVDAVKAQFKLIADKQQDFAGLKIFDIEVTSTP